MEVIEARGNDVSKVCLVCEFVLQEFASHWSPNMTYTDFLAELIAVCVTEPGISKECEALAELYGQDIYEALSGEVPADQVCTSLHLCSSSLSLETFAVDALTPGTKCLLCEILLEQIANGLYQNFTLADLDKNLDKLCLKLGEYASECETLVVLFGEEVYQALIGGIPANVVCTNIKLCNATSEGSSTEVAMVDAVESTFVCELCEDLLAESASYIPKNATIAEVRAILKADCQKNFGNLTEECEAFVFLFATDIYDALTGDVPPEQVCTAIYMCHKNKTTEVLAIVNTNVESEPVCTVCEDLLKVVAVFMDGNFTEAELKALLDNGCEQLGPFTPQCEALVIL